MNAKNELLNYVSEERIRCAFITYNPSCEYKDEQILILKDKHSEKDLKAFLDKLSFEYDAGYGLQHLCGTVWLKDDSWMERREYDGSEWWEHKVLPTIPKECLDVPQ